MSWYQQILIYEDSIIIFMCLCEIEDCGSRMFSCLLTSFLEEQIYYI